VKSILIHPKPDIVFGGWGSGLFWLPGDVHQYIKVSRDPAHLRGGGGGPACGSIGCPAGLGSVLAAGATDANDLIGAFHRGPSNWGQIKPDVAAPVLTSVQANNGDYQVWSGSAEASAHVAGTAA
jgi:hypothetical protein